jgi:SAM-dependent methyltransferase
MTDSDLRQDIIGYSSRSLEQRKNWYSPAATAYNRVRPRYPQGLIAQVVELAQLSFDSKILEIGCGPATATVSVAQLGCSMLCLEPNPDFYRLAQHNCQPYPNVEIQNIAFEEWNLETSHAIGQYDAVLAASSFHWIPSAVGYPKAAQALQENGHLILLWNKELQPRYEIYQHLSEVYRVYAPSLERYEDLETQEKILQGLGQLVTDSGYFKNLVAGYVECEVTYTADEYLTLLTTYSPYLKLDLQQKEALLKGLKDKMEQDLGGSLELFYISAFHIAQKR